MMQQLGEFEWDEVVPTGAAVLRRCRGNIGWHQVRRSQLHCTALTAGGGRV